MYSGTTSIPFYVMFSNCITYNTVLHNIGHSYNCSGKYFIQFTNIISYFYLFFWFYTKSFFS